MYRTHHCNELRKTDSGHEVKLAGWVAVRRDHGGVIFIDLRDREGLTQVVFRPEENAEVAKQSHSLRTEDVIQVCGAATSTGRVGTRLCNRGRWLDQGRRLQLDLLENSFALAVSREKTISSVVPITISAVV